VRKIYLSIDPIVTARSPPRHDSASRDQTPKNGAPFGRIAKLSACLFSHYHLLDPSTKWLGRGAFKL
jgi:hypothetical protein